jgi:hypothetical protein
VLTSLVDSLVRLVVHEVRDRFTYLWLVVVTVETV